MHEKSATKNIDNYVLKIFVENRSRQRTYLKKYICKLCEISKHHKIIQFAKIAKLNNALYRIMFIIFDIIGCLAYHNKNIFRM